MEDDFKIYDELCNFNSTGGSRSGESSQSLECEDEDRIYENLVDLIGGEEEDIFENVIFLNSIELERLPSNDIYEMVLHRKSNQQPKWKFKPRTLKSRVN